MARKAEAKILTRHPTPGKSGRNIARTSYDTLKSAILDALAGRDLTHSELFTRLNKALKGKFEGNIDWYGETVKLDLEARRIIERTDDRPEKLRLRKR